MIAKINLGLRCLHCTIRASNRPRQLCRVCYDKPSIRVRYPIPPRGDYYTLQRCTDPEEPTTAPPGSEAKIKVLMERASRGMSLWHPQDVTSFRMRE